MNARLTSHFDRLTLCLILSCIGIANLRADAAIFTDYFDGTQPKSARLEGPGCVPTQFPYFDSGIFQVSSSERYEIFHAHAPGQSLVVGVYTGPFNSGNVTQNRLALFQGVGGYGLSYDQLDLQAGTDYRLVVQPTCQQNDQSGIYRGPFGVAIAPLALESTAVASGGRLRPLPDYMQGVLNGVEPYNVNGPIRVPRADMYFITRIFHQGYLRRFNLRIYDAPFDPDQPLKNEISHGYWPFLGGDRAYLRANQDYYFVIQPESGDQTGKWMFTLAGQREFFINPGMNGNWWNPQVNGQGFFIDVLEDLGSVFVGWFTYDVEDPSGLNEATVGYSGARWLTAYGPYEGDSAILQLELTTGGLLGDPQRVVQNTAYGSLELNFQDCDNATVVYDIPASHVAGSMDIVRIDNGNEALCGDYFINNDGVLLTD